MKVPALMQGTPQGEHSSFAAADDTAESKYFLHRATDGLRQHPRNIHAVPRCAGHGCLHTVSASHMRPHATEHFVETWKMRVSTRERRSGHAHMTPRCIANVWMPNVAGGVTRYMHGMHTGMPSAIMQMCCALRNFRHRTQRACWHSHLVYFRNRNGSLLCPRRRLHEYEYDQRAAAAQCSTWKGFWRSQADILRQQCC